MTNMIQVCSDFLRARALTIKTRQGDIDMGALHSVDYEGLIPPTCVGCYVTTLHHISPQVNKLTFDEKVVAHRVEASLVSS